MTLPLWRWSPSDCRTFFDALMGSGDVEASAKLIERSAGSAYVMRARDPEFAAEFASAFEAVMEKIEHDAMGAMLAALKGKRSAIAGALVWREKKRADRLKKPAPNLLDAARVDEFRREIRRLAGTSYLAQVAALGGAPGG